MEYRELGQTGIRVSAIAFGGWAIGGWMWGGAERKNAVEAILAAYDQGITSIDTAPIYGKGLSEEIVGEALTIIPRSKVEIFTKFGLIWDQGKGELFFKGKDDCGEPIEVYKYAGRDNIINECEKSLRRLRTDYIDLYQIHFPDNTTPIEESMEALVILLRQGKIRSGGVCNYKVSQMQSAEKVIGLASNQVPYSMISRAIESDLVPHCLQQAKSLIAYSPLQRGVLAGRISPGHVFKEGDTRRNDPYYTDANIFRIHRFLDKIRPLAEDRNISLAQLAIRWTIDQPGITVALVGARDARQASENALAADVKLSAGDMDFINQEYKIANQS